MKGKRFWTHRRYSSRPPWAHDHRPPWTWDHDDHRGFAEWRKFSTRKRGVLFLRFVGAFGFVILFVVGGMAALAFLFTRVLGGEGQAAMLVWIGGCGLSLALPMLAAGLAMLAFRGIAMPLADIMAAADAVAEGDLTVRVPIRGRQEFARLAGSFNRMVEGLERADRQRRNLTADVAHELRTPLQIIQGNLEGVLDDVYEPTEEHISTTLEETRLLARLVDDLRTLSLAEAGQLPLVRESVDVNELLADVGTSFSGQAEAAGVDLRIEADGDAASMIITADAGRLDQMLGNLMANALRHTPSGGKITLRADPMDGGVRIMVSDTGEGIRAEELPAIFDRFWRGDRSRSRAGGAGSGLGLAIVRQLVQAHGGRIGVESEVGQGTTFIIELPGDGNPGADFGTP